MLKFQDARKDDEPVGIKFATSDDTWRVCVDNRDQPLEWFIWQRRHTPGSVQGYERRLACMRFEGHYEAECAASVLAALPGAGSIVQVLEGLQLRIRRARTALFFRSVAAVDGVVIAVRERAQRARAEAAA